jgi:dTDP-3-amino-2,3,6-trideoxy-4-keto-D-glucose/dTDP-3-amino-3,4,6-trideoxy-alpha-D-glucose/dTDP-2,6-dideoxy-D-kanosamine transaminase
MTTLAINDLGSHILPLQIKLNTAIARMSEGDWFVLGSEVTAFEREFVDYCGTPNGAPLANGTGALRSALSALNIGEGKNVVNAGMCSSVTMLDTCATPMYFDIAPDTLLIDVVELMRLAVTKRACAEVLTLPCSLKLADEESNTIITRINLW